MKGPARGNPEAYFDPLSVTIIRQGPNSLGGFLASPANIILDRNTNTLAYFILMQVAIKKVL